MGPPEQVPRKERFLELDGYEQQWLHDHGEVNPLCTRKQSFHLLGGVFSPAIRLSIGAGCVDADVDNAALIRQDMSRVDVVNCWQQSYEGC